MIINPKIIVLVVSIAALQCIEAATPIAIKPISVRNGCPLYKTMVYCYWSNRQCDAARRCTGAKICCPVTCGTSCIAPNYPECPPVDPQVQCIWYNEECNTSDKQCPANSVCCDGGNCGTQCRGPNREYVPNNQPVCPPVDPEVLCVMFNEECNASDKQCPANSICCSAGSCGTQCRGPNGVYVPNDVAVLE